MESRDHQRLVAVWDPGSGIAVHDVKCGLLHLFVCLFHNPILVSIVAQGRLVTVGVTVALRCVEW